MAELERVNLRGKIAGNQGAAEGSSTLVVIKQSYPAGIEIPSGSLVELTLGEPKLVLRADNLQPDINQTVHFTVEFVPKRPKPDPPSATYQFVFEKTPAKSTPAIPNLPGTQTEKNPSADHSFTELGSYFAKVSAIIDDRKITSEAVMIEVPQPEVPNSSATTGPAPGETSKPGQSKVGNAAASAQPDHRAQPGVPEKQNQNTAPRPERSPTQVPNSSRHIRWEAGLMAVLIVLAVLAAAYFFRKWIRRKDPSRRPQPESLKVKVTTGGRRITSQVLEPDRLKAECLTRVRWGRSPMVSRMTPRDITAKKKGSAHA